MRPWLESGDIYSSHGKSLPRFQNKERVHLPTARHGTIEENIFQRQLFKGELWSAVARAVEGLQEDGNFETEELKYLFRYNGNVKICETLNVLERYRHNFETDADGLREQFRANKVVTEEEGVRDIVWCDGDDVVVDPALNADFCMQGMVSYIHTKTSGRQSDVSCKIEGNYSPKGKPEKRAIASKLSDSYFDDYDDDYDKDDGDDSSIQGNENESKNLKNKFRALRHHKFYTCLLCELRKIGF